MKQLIIGALALAMLFGLAGTASAQDVPNVQGLQPFTEATRYMSLPGYLRWQYHEDTGSWLTYAQAVAYVRQQGVVVAGAPSD